MTMMCGRVRDLEPIFASLPRPVQALDVASSLIKVADAELAAAAAGPAGTAPGGPEGAAQSAPEASLAEAAALLESLRPAQGAVVGREAATRWQSLKQALHDCRK